jgi:hypothetical protein
LLKPVGYTCVFSSQLTGHRIPAARDICTQRRGTFADLLTAYTCILPAATQATRSTN